MSDQAQWYRQNDAFLSAALERLRSRLREGRQAAAAPGTSGPSQGLDIPVPSPEPPPALTALAARLELTPFEQEVLLLCAAAELDTGFPRLFAEAQRDPSRGYPTASLAMALFDGPHWNAFSPDRPLRRWRLITLDVSNAPAMIAAPIRIDERTLSFLKGMKSLDPRIASLASEVPAELEPLPPSQEQLSGRIAASAGAERARKGSVVAVLTGTDFASKMAVAARAAAGLGVRLFRLPASILPVNPEDLAQVATLWSRESLMEGTALLLEAADDHEGDGLQGRVARFIDRSSGMFFIDAREAFLPPHDGTLFDVRRPLVVEQRSAWAEALRGEDAVSPSDLAGTLAGQFDLDAAAIRRISRGARGVSPELLEAALWESCLAESRPRLEGLALRIEPRAKWEDLVLPSEQSELLRQISDQVRTRAAVYEDWGFARRMSRGLGITALFAGETGTGKTMAAEVLASALGLDLYRVDLSAVVSKYIGETEKNLRRVFDSAEAGGAILFFDEADALFGKRSEVKDSHDRYANIEINYLLQRMEQYKGLAILATNQKSALDPAFMRRIRFIVNFPFPATGERLEIWRRAFPPETPVRDLDFGRLAKMNLTGGNIQSIALNAAFSSARRGNPVDMPAVLDAVRAEFRKLERPINEGDFRTGTPGAPSGGQHQRT